MNYNPNNYKVNNPPSKNPPIVPDKEKGLLQNSGKNSLQNIELAEEKERKRLRIAEERRLIMEDIN